MSTTRQDVMWDRQAEEAEAREAAEYEDCLSWRESQGLDPISLDEFRALCAKASFVKASTLPAPADEAEVTSDEIPF